MVDGANDRFGVNDFPIPTCTGFNSKRRPSWFIRMSLSSTFPLVILEEEELMRSGTWEPTLSLLVE